MKNDFFVNQCCLLLMMFLSFICLWLSKGFAPSPSQGSRLCKMVCSCGSLFFPFLTVPRNLYLLTELFHDDQESPGNYISKFSQYLLVHPIIPHRLILCSVPLNVHLSDAHLHSISLPCSRLSQRSGIPEGNSHQ